MDDRLSNHVPEVALVEMRLRIYASLERLEERAAQTYAQVARSREMIERSRELLENFKDRFEDYRRSLEKRAYKSL